MKQAHSGDLNGRSVQRLEFQAQQSNARDPQLYLECVRPRGDCELVQVIISTVRATCRSHQTSSAHPIQRTVYLQADSRAAKISVLC